MTENFGEAVKAMIDSGKCKELMEGLSLESIRKAFSAALERRITSLSPTHNVYVFQGEDEDYILIPFMYCSCPDFRIRVIAKGEKKYCYHLLSLCLSINNEMIDHLGTSEDNVIYTILEEIIKAGKSHTLRSLRR